MACLLDIANFYIAEHELYIKKNYNIFYYSRFINNILLVIYADSKEKVLKIAQEIIISVLGLTYI